MLLVGAAASDSLHSQASAPAAPERIIPTRGDRGDLVPRTNYRQAKKQKELSRKARQLEKQQRRTARPTDSGDIATPLQDPPAGPSDPTSSGHT
ncbi:MAG: hypothetical protein ACREUL_15750 [Steroidobacteraceae bacterium]